MPHEAHLGRRGRYAKEKVEFDAKMQKRLTKEQASGKKSGSRPPKPPEAGIRDKDQINLTEEDSRIMPVRSNRPLQRRAYADSMPVLPALGPELASLGHWLVLPPVVIGLLRRQGQDRAG